MLGDGHPYDRPLRHGGVVFVTLELQRISLDLNAEKIREATTAIDAAI
jgi:hypothetical protein